MKTKALQKVASFRILRQRFLEDQDVKETTKRSYGAGIDRFFAWVQQTGIQEPTRTDILQYKRHLKGELAALTVSTYLVVVRKFFAWAESQKIYPNIAADIKGLKRPKGFRRDPLTEDQAKQLIASIDTDTLQDRRDRALIALLLGTGLRTIEAVRANIGDLRQQGGEPVLWVQGKGRDSKDAFVVIRPGVLRTLRQYLHARGATEPDRPLFTSLSNQNHGERLSTRTISRIVKQRLADIDIEDARITAHSLRHTTATIAVKHGAPVQEVQAMHRHADVSTTMIYVHLTNRIEKNAERTVDAALFGTN